MSGNKQDMQSVENAKKTSASTPEGLELKKLCVKMIREEQSKRTEQLQQSQQTSTRRNVTEQQNSAAQIQLNRENALRAPSNKG